MAATSPTAFAALLADSGKRNRDREIIQALVDSLYAPVTSEVTDASYDIVASDSGTTLRGNNASAQTFTANNDDFSVGESFKVKQIGAGRITTSITGATVVSPNGTQATRNAGSELTFFKASSTGWECTGDELVPSFLASVGNGQQDNITGTGTVATVVFDSEEYDNGGVFGSGTTFTAPVDGIYALETALRFNGVTAAADQCEVQFVISSSDNILTIHEDTDDVPRDFTMTVSGTVQLSAGDTVHVTAECSGEATDVVDIEGATSLWLSYFSGHLVA